MRTLRIAAVGAVTIVIASALAVPPALADHDGGQPPGTSYTNIATYCADVQLEVARIKAGSVTINTVAYDESSVEGTRVGYRAFRSAKTLVDGPNRTITVRQWVVKDAEGNPLRVMCKTKSQDALLPVLGKKTFRGRAGDCQDVTTTILRRAFAGLPRASKDAAEDTLERTTVDATEYDDFGGNLWTVPDYETIVEGSDGRLHLRSEGLYTPADPNTALTDAFVDFLNTSFGLSLPYGTTNGEMVALGFTDPLTLGVHYCTVPAVPAVQKALVG